MAPRCGAIIILIRFNIPYILLFYFFLLFLTYILTYLNFFLIIASDYSDVYIAS
jgi:hypothetical protein